MPNLQEAVEAKYKQFKKRGGKQQPHNAPSAVVPNAVNHTCANWPKYLDRFKNSGGGPGDAKS
jgi:hypothetical protein